MNNMPVSPPNLLISGVNVKWTTYSLQNSSSNGQSVKKRKFTGLPKGKTVEEQNSNIRKRVSYRWIVQEAQYFRSKGVPLHSIPVVMSYVIDQKCMYKGGFAYSSNRYWARQSLHLFLEDIKDHKMVEELKLN